MQCVCMYVCVYVCVCVGTERNKSGVEVPSKLWVVSVCSKSSLYLLRLPLWRLVPADVWFNAGVVLGVQSIVEPSYGPPMLKAFERAMEIEPQTIPEHVKHAVQTYRNPFRNQEDVVMDETKY